MFILNFGIVFSLSIIYGYLVKHRVEKFDYPTRMRTSSNDGDENQETLPSPNPDQNARDIRECLGRFSTFSIYVVHLLVARIIPLLVFALWIFYPAQFPTDFSCPWRPDMQGKGASNFSVTLNSRNNLTVIDCTNPVGRKSKTLVYIVATADVCLVTLSFLELGYISWLAFNDRDFMNDEKFCTVYLLRKSRKSVNQVDDEEVYQVDDEEVSLNKIREGFDGQKVFEVKDNFGGTDISRRPLEDIYVNVTIQEGTEREEAYPRGFERHEIYQCHLKAPSTVTTLTSPADIFKPTKDGENQTYPRTILVIGRPGIGKTILANKLLHQWKGHKDKDDFYREKIVILLRFRSFYNKNDLTFRDMLAYGEGLSPDIFEEVYKAALSNPTKTVLIFDGLDELDVDSNLLNDSIPAVDDIDEKMSVFIIWKKLLHNRLLPGVTVLTTSRPTAQRVFNSEQVGEFDRTVEILGFFKEQIKEYALKFCKDPTTNGLIWDRIEESDELLSLCYIPANTFIVCLTLKESIGNDEINPHRDIPKTLTELYKRAVKVLLYRHHPKFKVKPRPKDYLITPFPKELDKDLMKIKEVAKKGIRDGKLIFEKSTAEGFGELANSGFFHELPDKERKLFCFLHLTLQEFLAASKVVDDMDKVVQFLDEHVNDPKWHLVIQFVAGLVGDKRREDPIKYESHYADIQKRYYTFRIVYSI
jgi:GTPase SAR1 family protein